MIMACAVVVYGNNFTHYCMGGYFGTLRNGSTDTEYNKYILVTKSFVNENKCRSVGMEPSKTSWNHATTISHHTYIHLTHSFEIYSW